MRFSTRIPTLSSFTAAFVCALVLCPASNVSAAQTDASDNTPLNRPGSAAVVLYPDPPYAGVPRDDIDEFGGWLGLQGKATGFFHTEKIGNRWWLVTPKGNAYFAIGVRDIPHDGSSRRLKAWGFNCAYVGGERPTTADEGFPYMLNLKFIRLAKQKLPVKVRPGLPPWATYYDVFDPEWAAACDAYAEKNLKPHANDPLMVGYWIENETSFDGWYQAATHTALDAPARKAFVEVARAYYANKPDQLVKDWAQYNVQSVDDIAKVEGDPPNVPDLAAAWEAAVAEKTFSTIQTAARKVDPNHINLGVRMMAAAPPSPAILSAMSKYIDVLSMNLYSPFSDRLLTQIFTIAPLLSGMLGMPIMTSEFSYRGADTMCPNTLGAPPTVPTQADRGIGYLSYVSAVASLPCFVGVNWYTYNDDSIDKRWDEYGEDCNFGIVDRQDRPYAALVEAMRVTNSSIYELAADPVPNPSCGIFYRTELMRWDKEFTKEYLRRYAHLENPIPDPLAEMLPGDRRFHDTYWIHHESPSLIVNDPRFLGDCQANVIRQRKGGHELTLLGIRYFTTFPRSLWYGKACENPDKTLVLDANPQVLVRDVDDNGLVRRMTMIDGTFATINVSNVEFRTDRKVPYLDLQYDHEAKKLTIITRGELKNLGVRGVAGWTATWNDAPVQPVDIAAPEEVTVFAFPGK